MALCAKSINTGTFLYKIIHGWNFSHKDQVITEHWDLKWQDILYNQLQTHKLLSLHNVYTV